MSRFTNAMQGELDKIALSNDTLPAAESFAQYKQTELAQATALATKLGYNLDAEQIHAAGERFIMSGKKLVLTGTRQSDKQRVIIKYSTDRSGRQEITHEHLLAERLNQLDFAAHSFAAPAEYEYRDDGTSTVRVVEYITEDIPLLQLTTEQQFFSILRSLTTQAGLHATTAGHIRDIKAVFGLATATDYLAASEYYQTFITANAPTDSANETITQAVVTLHTNKSFLAQYAGFLTHTDFAPHNVRAKGTELYLLDQTSLHFGNKHESWARMINYLLLYNFELANYLLQYVADNRSPEEVTSLRMMRIYKLLYLLAFYCSSYQKTIGDHKELSLERLTFWHQVLECTLADTLPTPEQIATYTQKRDALRNQEEKNRQRELGQL